MKNLAVILSLLLSGCGIFKEEPQFNTEIFCPNSSYRILILQSTKAEVEKSIIDAIEYNQKSNKRNRYTVLYLPNNRSTSIYNATPQELISQCQLTERPRKPIYSNPASL
ncbi:MAG: hypothetical protein V4612_03305 [Pseudomonadota bacterium]